MNKVIIRKAQPEDSRAIFELIQELATFEKEPTAVIITAGDILKLGFGTDAKFNCIVAEYNKNIVGMALFYQRFSTWKGLSTHLEDLIVTKNYRRKGIGKKLYRAFIEHAFNNKASRIEWEVLTWNVEAIKFYKASGAVILDDWKLVKMSRKTMRSYLDKIPEKG